jgi:hypothetical protein
MEDSGEYSDLTGQEETEEREKIQRFYILIIPRFFQSTSPFNLEHYFFSRAL